jgi:tetratricopeptide (TPR) repeat protein
MLSASLWQAVLMASTELLAAAMRLLRAGSWQEAEAAACAAVAEDAGDANAHLLLGLAVAAMGEAERAAPGLCLVAGLRPDAGHPCRDLAALRPALPQRLVARQFAACLRLAPGDAGLRLAYAEFLLDHDDPLAAGAVLRDGPPTAAGQHLLGLALAEAADFPGAVDSFRRAAALDPRAAASWSNLGMVLKVEGRFEEALAAHDRAVALAPGDARFQVNRAVALLKSGDWLPAWDCYEARLDLTPALPIDRARLMPSLRPREPLTGRTVAVVHEEGFGDTLQFLRYVPLLAERGARVVACVPAPLERLMRRVPGVAEVWCEPQGLPPHDLVCPVFSLPRVFATTPATVPPVPVLRPDPGLERQWRRSLPLSGLRVGIVWAGQARPSLAGFRTLDRRRSAGLAALAPLAAVPGVRLVSLQAGPPARQVPPPGMALADPMADVRDFADTAAIIAALDVVVSVDTSVVHLAGLMGKPVLLLDRYDGCWRWLSGRRDSPWYPRLTIFRQHRPGDWEGAVAQATESLRAWR